MLLSACAQKHQTQEISGDLSPEAMARVFVIPAGSADERIHLLAESRDHDWNAAMTIFKDERDRAEAEMEKARVELKFKMLAQIEEGRRLGKIYNANREAVGLPPRHLMGLVRFPGGVGGVEETQATPAFLQNQAKIDSLIRATFTNRDELDTQLTNTTLKMNDELVRPGDVATLYERIDHKPPSNAITNLLTTALGHFEVEIPANGRFELLILQKTETANSITFTVWKTPAKSHQALTRREAFRSETVMLVSGNRKVKPQ